MDTRNDFNELTLDSFLNTINSSKAIVNFKQNPTKHFQQHYGFSLENFTDDDRNKFEYQLKEIVKDFPEQPDVLLRWPHFSCKTCEVTVTAVIATLAAAIITVMATLAPEIIASVPDLAAVFAETATTATGITYLAGVAGISLAAGATAAAVVVIGYGVSELQAMLPFELCKSAGKCS